MFTQAMTDFFGAASAAAASAVPATLPLIGTFRTWPRWPTMSAVGGTAEVVARLVAIIEGWLDSLVASPKIFRT